MLRVSIACIVHAHLAQHVLPLCGCFRSCTLQSPCTGSYTGAVHCRPVCWHSIHLHAVLKMPPTFGSVLDISGSGLLLLSDSVETLYVSWCH
jgi:hypothetical protein